MIYSGIRGFRQLVTLLLPATESTKSIDAQLSLSLSLLFFIQVGVKPAGWVFPPHLT